MHPSVVWAGPLHGPKKGSIPFGCTMVFEATIGLLRQDVALVACERLAGSIPVIHPIAMPLANPLPVYYLQGGDPQHAGATAKCFVRTRPSDHG